MHLQFIFLVALDQITKAYFASRDFFFLGLHLHPVKNFGLPFGFDFGGFWNFTILFIVYVTVGWVVLRPGRTDKWSYLAKSIFIAGATSNLADRLIYGYVRDFIDIQLGFVFNFADVLIVLGIIMLVVSGKKTAIQKTSQVDNLPPTGNS